MYPFAAPIRSCISGCTKKIAKESSKLWRRREVRRESISLEGDGSGRRMVVSEHTPNKREVATAQCFEAAFVNALVVAGTCAHHASPSPALKCNRRFCLSDTDKSIKYGKHTFSTCSSTREPGLPAIVWRDEEESARRITAQEYKRLVNTYDTEEAHLEIPQRRQPLAPRLFLTPEQEERTAPRFILPPNDEHHQQALQHLQNVLRDHKPGYVNLAAVWVLWQKLPGPRVRYVEDTVIRLLFRHLAAVEFKDMQGAKERYFALLEDCIGEKVQIMREEWNTAIAFAGRQARTRSGNDVSKSVEMWMRMEDYGKKADSITFNILFDVAVKARRYALAETILDELHSRRLPLNRFLRTGLIYYAGIRGDGDSVRKAFNDLVEADEIIDTTVMNAVIVSLIRAGEAPAADNVFGKMKQLYELKAGTAAVRSWQKQREMGSLLNDTARKLREEKRAHERSFFGGVFSHINKKEAVQKAAPIAPDANTYRILIKHQCFTGGDLERIQALLQEMAAQDFPIHGSVYTNIMRGFEIHGGYAFSTWRKPQLEMFWQAFLHAQAGGQSVLGGQEEALNVPASITTASASPSDGASDLSEYDIDSEFWRAHDSDLAPSVGTQAALTSSEDDGQSIEPSETWDLLLKMSEEDRPPYFTRALAKATLRSFYQCAGARRMLEVWEDIKDRWKDMPPEDRDNLQYSVNWMRDKDRAMEAGQAWL